MKRTLLVAAACAAAIAGCGQSAQDKAEQASEESGVPLCEDVLSGDATIPASKSCVDEDKFD